jgi:hypothetical protein
VLNANASAKANRFQTCFFSGTDSIRGRFCLNTTAGHVQLDTTLHAITPEKLLGEWQVVAFGTFEVTDSMALNAPLYNRQQAIVNENKNPLGSITFTKDKLRINFKNIHEIPSKKASYTVIDGKYLATKALFARSSSTIVGLTKDNFLILDDHTYRTQAKQGQYMLIKTTIRRIILKRNATS